MSNALRKPKNPFEGVYFDGPGPRSAPSLDPSPSPEPYPAPSPKRPPRNDVRAKQQWALGDWQDELLDARARGAITHPDCTVGFYLSRRANNETGEVKGRWAPIAKIALNIGAKIDSKGGCSVVSRALARLQRAGLLRLTRRFNAPSDILLLQAECKCSRRQIDSVLQTPSLTKSGNSFEGKADNRLPSVLDDEMRKIAGESKMDDWAVDAQFKVWIARNEKDGVRLHHPKEAWRGFCKKYKREVGRDFEGNPMWCPELLPIALANGIPDERGAQRWFFMALKKRERGRKGRKKDPVHHVISWWKTASKGWHEDRDRKESREAVRRPD